MVGDCPQSLINTARLPWPRPLPAVESLSKEWGKGPLSMGRNRKKTDGGDFPYPIKVGLESQKQAQIEAAVPMILK